ncbi:hypothetical protein M409DRAFT_24773 [Zasmidium cellare ATCC 36951]|uniref:Myb-like domain-containing protein n=1 Tax=Zasmidium cellare ATCC 36951 TaxID=1080233 RepID=A0A6A6CFD0_ZASCE|nr:uncharacterized protein M409DRAFT_24773 [Zasmidium cellare ATCC 36951]KAF2164868.1 hypothetical protein M409DRAFT_24773 [Zasmidium cellare ATCC 36951]
MTLNLTAREQELLCAVIDVMKADIDWKAVAPKANYNTAKQARDKWPSVRNKITAVVKATDGEDGAGTPATGGKKKATPKKRKTSEDETPSKSKKAKKDSPLAEEDDEEGTGLIKPEDESDEGGLN